MYFLHNTKCKNWKKQKNDNERKDENVSVNPSC